MPRGASLDVRAQLVSFTSGTAEIVLQASGSNELVRLPMIADSAATGFVVRVFDVMADTRYWVESEGVQSPRFTLTVTDLPAVRRLSMEIRYPVYTGLERDIVEDGGDVAAVIGTTVSIRAHLTRAVRGGTLRFDDGTSVAMRVTDDSTLAGVFTVRRDAFYRIDLEAADGTPVEGLVQYAVVALEDRPPSVRITQPGRDTKVTSVEELVVGVDATDDFGVRGVELRMSVNGGAERVVTLAADGGRGGPEFSSAHTLFIDEYALEPGDLITYYAVARDAAAGESRSDIYFLEVRPFARDYRQAESGGEMPAGEGGEGGASPGALSERQKEIAAATFNVVRDSATTSPQARRENLVTLAIAQGKLRDDVGGLAARLESRGMTQEDSAFVVIKAALDSATTHMRAAEDQLGRGFARGALSPEQRALQHLQRAQAVFREVQVQMQQEGGGGGGGGGEQGSENLADLFEMDTDKLRNQYESVQRNATTAARQEVDEARERLRQLAQRQQQENERAQRMADALRARLGREAGSGGGGSAQRDLARAADEEARRLERLSRERQSPELADAAARARQAADAMRQAASGSQSQGATAVERLRSATRELDQARTAEARRSGAQARPARCRVGPASGGDRARCQRGGAGLVDRACRSPAEAGRAQGCAPSGRDRTAGRC